MVIIDVCTGDVIDTEKTEKPKEKNIFAEIHYAIYDFENCFGIHPNRIIMGSDLVDRLYKYYGGACCNEELIINTRLGKEGIIGKFEGFPVKIDYDNPRRLEVGYMIERNI